MIEDLREGEGRVWVGNSGIAVPLGLVGVLVSMFCSLLAIEVPRLSRGDLGWGATVRGPVRGGPAVGRPAVGGPVLIVSSGSSSDSSSPSPLNSLDSSLLLVSPPNSGSFSSNGFNLL